MRDLVSNISPALALAPAVQSASVDGIAIDLKGCNSVAFLLNTGAIASAGAFSAKIQESDTTTGGDFTDAAAAVVSSNAPATLLADSAYKLSYTGFKRYARLVLTKTGGTSIAAGAVAVRSDLADRPAS